MRGRYRWRCNNYRPERTPDPSSASRRGTSWTIAIGAAVSSARDISIAVSSISSRATSLGSRPPRNRHQAPRLMEFRIDEALLPGSGLPKSEYFRARRQIDERVNADQPIHNGNLANFARSGDGKKTLPLRAEPQHGRRQISSVHISMDYTTRGYAPPKSLHPSFPVLRIPSYCSIFWPHCASCKGWP